MTETIDVCIDSMWSKERCTCKRCAARSRYINAAEHAQRLHNRGASVLEIAHAESVRDKAGDAWERACNPGEIIFDEPTDEGYFAERTRHDQRDNDDAHERASQAAQSARGHHSAHDRTQKESERNTRDVSALRGPGARRANCRSPECRAPIIWCGKITGDKPLILDVVPVLNGNIELDEETGFAHYVKPDPEIVRYVSHFATCPERQKWRKQAERNELLDRL
jgi:hypothetical protein